MKVKSLNPDSCLAQILSCLKKQELISFTQLLFMVSILHPENRFHTYQRPSTQEDNLLLAAPVSEGMTQ